MFALPAQASTLRPNVLIRGLAPVDGLPEGAGFALPVDIFVSEDVVLEEVRVRADRQDAVAGFEPALERAAIEVPPGYRHERRVLRGVLEEGLDEIRIQVTAGGEVWEERVRLRSLGDAEDPGRAVAVARGAGEDLLDPAQFERPDPVPSGFPVAQPSASRAAREVTVTGRILMTINENITQRGVDGATVYLMQLRRLADDLEMGSTTTDVNGNFVLTTTLDDTMNVYVKVRAANSAANVGTNVFFETYGRNLPVTFRFGGTSLNVGSRVFEGDFNHALWLLTTFTRQQRYFQALMGWDLPQVNCRWIDDVLGSSCYLPIPGMEGIHLRSSATWRGNTVAHEYGHHVVHRSPIAEVWPPLYTNGVCDPGHCGTCPENPQVAWSEGVPHFLQAEFARFHRGIYGWNLPNWEDMEFVAACTENNVFAEDPDSTEDFITALLIDLVDARPDSSSLAPGIVEYSELTIQDVLNAAIEGYASNTFKFLDAMREYLSRPEFDDSDRREFWAAAAVNGLAVDTEPPLPSSISVPTHPVGLTAATNLPAIVFSGGIDDVSGVYRHRVDIAASAGAPGPGALFFRDSSISWPTPLPEGTWWINYTSFDRAGNESVVRSYGPFSVGPLAPVDLTLHRPGLWEDEFLARHDQSVTASAGAIETTLVSGNNTWLSLSTSNSTTGSAVVEPFRHIIYLDGNAIAQGSFSPGTMTPGAVYQILNAGPFQLPGGRHHVKLALDFDHSVDELDDANTFNRYLVVRPPVLAPGPWQTGLPTPPRPYTVDSDGFQAYPNQAGHRVVPQNVFAGVTMVTPEASTDNRLRLHRAVTDFDTGFESPLVIADTQDGTPETIIVNKNQLASSIFDFGVERVRSGPTGGYSIRHVSSQSLGSGDDTSVSWQAGDLLSLIEYQFSGFFDTGTTSIILDVNFHPSDILHELELYWMEPGQGTLRPHQVEPDLLITTNGRHVLELNVPSSGRYCLVAYRDVPSDMLAWPMSFSVVMNLTARPDLSVDRLREFWDLPLLPSAQPVQGPGVPVPGELTGEGFDTYLNYAIRNQGLVAASNIEVIVDLDGVTGQQFFWSQLPSLAGASTMAFNDSNPIFVPGGRHTMVLKIDPQNSIQEGNEQNNWYAAQFGWVGTELAEFTNVVMDTPPDPTAGSQLIEIVNQAAQQNGEDPDTEAVNPWYPNSDGFRLPALPAQRTTSAPWSAVAVMPSSTIDVNVRLHEVLPPRRAFGEALAASTWGDSQTDFVLIDRSVAGMGAYDVSVVRAGGSIGDYTIANLTSQPLGAIVPGTNMFGQFGMDAGGFLALRDVHLEPGTYAVSIHPLSADADMGISVFLPTTPGAEPFHSKDDGMDGQPMAYEAPPGQPDTAEFEVRPGEEGYACVAVWKAWDTDMELNQDYMIEVVFTPSAPECIAIDGLAEPEYGTPAAVQTVQTHFGDATDGLVDVASGSELDQAFARICDDTLYLTFAGNLESNYNDFELFLDTRPGGQNSLLPNNPVLGPNDDLNRMADAENGIGFTFDPGFEPDWWFTAQGGLGEVFEGMPYRLFVYRAELLTQGGGAGTFLGATAAGARGILREGGGGVASPVRVAIDNSNVAGVTGGTGPGSGAGVTSGIEFAIPLSEIGDPDGCLGVLAFINGKSHDFVSNQFLPPLGAAVPSLGEPRAVDLSLHPGTQYFTVCVGVTAVEGELPAKVVRDVVLRAPAPNPFNPRTSLAFDLPRTSKVDLVLYDVAGRRVRTLVDAVQLGAGSHEYVWNGLDDHGRQVASGNYLLRLVADGEQRVQKLTLLK